MKWTSESSPPPEHMEHGEGQSRSPVSEVEAQYHELADAAESFLHSIGSTHSGERARERTAEARSSHIAGLLLFAPGVSTRR